MIAEVERSKVQQPQKKDPKLKWDFQEMFLSRSSEQGKI